MAIDAAEALRRLRAAGEASYGVPNGASPAGPTTGPTGVGYVCSYVPEELILAAGLNPVRLGARPGPVGPANGSLQSFACSFARGLLDELLSGRAGRLGGVVFAHTCDSLRAAMESWKVHAPAGAFVHYLNLPARVEGPGVTVYAAAEMARLAAALGKLPGARPVTAESLTDACRLAARVRGALSRLAALRSRRPDLLPGSVFLAAARGAGVLDRTMAAELLGAAARFERAEKDEGAAASGGPASPPAAGGSASAPPAGLRPRVLVSGGFLETEEPLRLIEEAGADVVADDLCLGGRRLALPEAPPPAGANLETLFAWLAGAYLGRVPCPTKHPVTGRLAAVEAQARVGRVQGVIFLLQKFCESHAFDYPAFRETLEGQGFPCLLLEVEQGGLGAGQARTRLEAFVERLRGPVPGQAAAGGVAR